MRLKIFSYVFWPEQFLINELARELSALNIEIEVVTGLPNYPQGEFFSGYGLLKGPYVENYGPVRISRYPVLARKKGFAFLALNYFSHMCGAFLRIFRVEKADWAFVYATSPITTALPALFWAWLRGAKVCIWLQDLWPDSVAAVGASGKKSFFYRCIGGLVRFIYSQTDLMLIQSPGFAGHLKEFGYRGVSYVVPNWAPSVDMGMTERPPWLPLFPEKFLLTFAGNVGKAQSVETLLQAAEILKTEKDLHFLIVGDGSELSRMREQAKERKLENISFLGRQPLADMPGLFRASDALLVSLKRDPIFEKTIPSKVQAYMAAGRPLVGSLDGVGRELILTAQCGVCAPAEDAGAMAQEILNLKRSSPEQRKNFADNASSYSFQNFTKERIVGQIYNYLERHK